MKLQSDFIQCFDPFLESQLKVVQPRIKGVNQAPANLRAAFGRLVSSSCIIKKNFQIFWEAFRKNLRWSFLELIFVIGLKVFLLFDGELLFLKLDFVLRLSRQITGEKNIEKCIFGPKIILLKVWSKEKKINPVRLCKQSVKV